MNRLLVLILCATLYIVAGAQTATKSTITINRVEVLDGSLYGNGNPSSTVISELGLTQKSFRGIYSYWTFPSALVSSLSNLDGSSTSLLRSLPLDISVTNKGQEITFEVKNNSHYWISIDPSSTNYNISYFVGEDVVPYSGVDFDKTLGTLFNYERGEYDLIILPPRAKASWSMFRIDGMQKGYDIISSCIKNGSRMDCEFPIFIYSTDPITSELSSLRNKQTYQYAQYTPTQARLSYHGAYYKEGEAFHVHNDYIDKFKPTYNYTMEQARLKLVCEINKSSAVTTKKNKFGLEVYAK